MKHKRHKKKRIPYRLIAFAVVVVVCGLPLLIWDRPLAFTVALDNVPVGKTCPPYNYLNPDVKQYHVMLGQLGEFQHLRNIPKGDIGCRKPISAKLYL
jgi:hypothetical protein